MSAKDTWQQKCQGRSFWAGLRERERERVLWCVNSSLQTSTLMRSEFKDTTVLLIPKLWAGTACSSFSNRIEEHKMLQHSTPDWLEGPSKNMRTDWLLLSSGHCENEWGQFSPSQKSNWGKILRERDTENKRKNNKSHFPDEIKECIPQAALPRGRKKN